MGGWPTSVPMVVVPLLVCCLISPAMAEPDPKRRMAVLEYRGGSAELPGAADRIAEHLRATTSLTIVSSAEARAGLAELDARLSQCAGDAACVARVGSAIGASEVLLVGVAEFGDVILTLQRVDVQSQAVVTRVAEALEPGARPSDDVIDGYVRRVLPASDFRRYGMLRVATDLAGAAVEVAGTRRGTTPIAPMRVSAPAAYEILVSKAGYQDFRASVQVPPDGQVVVRANLVARQSTRPWYGRWWVWALAGAAVAGGVTAAVVYTRSDSDQVPVTISPF